MFKRLCVILSRLVLALFFSITVVASTTSIASAMCEEWSRGGMNYDECLALYDIYIKTSATQWTWDVWGERITCKEDGWDGNYSTIQCSGSDGDENRHVTGIYLNEDIGMNGPLPNDPFLLLKELRFLYLPNNLLSGTIPRSIGELPHLRMLVLRNNQLSGSIPDYLDSLYNLSVLDLSQNQFSGVIPPSFRNDFQYLRILNLGSNQLSGPIPEELLGPINLEFTHPYPGLVAISSNGDINLGGNNFSGSLPVDLGRNWVDRLSVTSNSNLTGQIPAAYSQYSQLDTLYLMGTNICEPESQTMKDWVASLSTYRGSGVVCGPAPIPPPLPTIDVKTEPPLPVSRPPEPVFDDFVCWLPELFKEPSLYFLFTTKTGFGSGTVTSSSSKDINCGKKCSEGYAQYASVTLKAIPDSGSIFSGWQGGDCKGTGDCTLSMTRNKHVVATFTQTGSTAPVTPPWTPPGQSTNSLFTSQVGTGSGFVASSPAGISCGTDCNNQYSPGTSVTLTAYASNGSRFIGWIGGDCSSSGNCTVTLNQSMTVTAAFMRNIALAPVCSLLLKPRLISLPKCGDDKVYDCAGVCVDLATAESFIGDGYCDNGLYGYDLRCDDFQNDAGDCDNILVGCGDGKVYDCAGTCVELVTAESYIGDGYCDDGLYGYDLQCDDFQNDAGDCDIF